MPKVIDHPEMRRDILVKSLRIFGERGYQTVSMRILADEIGVTTGVLYHYFANKEELVQAVLQMGLEASIVGTNSDRTFQQVNKDLSIKRKIETLFQEMSEDDDIAITNIMLLSDYFRDLKSREKIRRNYKVPFRFLDSFRQSMGLNRDEMEIARFVLTYLVGMHTIRMWTAKKMSIKEFGATFMKFFETRT